MAMALNGDVPKEVTQIQHKNSVNSLDITKLQNLLSQFLAEIAEIATPTLCFSPSAILWILDCWQLLLHIALREWRIGDLPPSSGAIAGI